MHPPSFTLDQPLSAWPDCFLELTCPGCGRKSICPVRLLRAEHGDVTFRTIVPRLTCSACKARPAPVFLCAGQHRMAATTGTAPDWAVELVSAERPHLIDGHMGSTWGKLGGA